WLKERGANNYILERGDDLVLIDAGFSTKAKGIFKYIKSELQSKNVSTVLLTHHHVDHIRGLHYLTEKLKPRVFSSEEDAKYINGELKQPARGRILKPFFFLGLKFLRNKPVKNIEFLKDKDEIEGLLVHHLPGHTMGSLGFQFNDIFFSGDAVVSGKNGEAKLAPKIMNHSTSMAENSFKKAGSLKITMLLGGHGPPILKDASIRIAEAIEKFDKK
ncbi:MAG: MBL fold metallo-hydrolase, partial [Candidatus Heimdallarchaeota archaeon]|nr:MBL fold metallo-hydrolase [Candidatus Heimdallarchaeota archaeon]